VLSCLLLPAVLRLLDWNNTYWFASAVHADKRKRSTQPSDRHLT